MLINVKCASHQALNEAPPTDRDPSEICQVGGALRAKATTDHVVQAGFNLHSILMA